MDWTIIITTAVAGLSPIIVVALTLRNQQKNEFKKEMSTQYYFERLNSYSKILACLYQLRNYYSKYELNLDFIGNTSDVLKKMGKEDMLKFKNDTIPLVRKFSDDLEEIYKTKSIYLPNELPLLIVNVISSNRGIELKILQMITHDDDSDKHKKYYDGAKEEVFLFHKNLQTIEDIILKDKQNMIF